MRLSSLALLHLAGVSAGLLAIKAATWPGRSTWIVVVGAAVCGIECRGGGGRTGVRGVGMESGRVETRLELHRLVDQLSDEHVAEVLAFVCWLVRQGQAVPVEELQGMWHRVGERPRD